MTGRATHTTQIALHERARKTINDPNTGREIFAGWDYGHQVAYAVHVTADLEAIAKALASRAANSKKRMATAMHGAIIVSVKRR